MSNENFPPLVPASQQPHDSNNPSDSPIKVSTPTVNNDSLDPTSVTLNLMNFPIVVLYGPRNVGKSSIMGSLIFYTEIHSKKYGLSFEARDGTVGNPPTGYLEVSNRFIQESKGREMISGSPDFIAVSVLKNKETKFFILEAPGEHFFKIDEPSKPPLRFHYLRNLFLAKNNKKVVCYVFSSSMFKNHDNSQELQRQYLNNIKASIAYLKPSDSIIVIATKINNNVNQHPMDDDMVKSWFKVGGEFEQFGLLFDTCQVKKYSVIPYASHNILPEENNTREGRQRVQHLNEKYQQHLMRVILEETKEPGFFSKLFSKN